jgi:hypothetical protein
MKVTRARSTLLRVCLSVCRWNMVTVIRLFVKMEGNDNIMDFGEIRENVV